MTRFLFAGTPHEALLAELRALGHEAECPPECDWWAASRRGDPPERWADAAVARVATYRPDAFVLHKGWDSHPARGGGWWCVPPAALWRLRAMVGRMVYVCADDPTATPVTLKLGIGCQFDLWLTTCPGIAELFAIPRAQVHEFWLAWDARIPQPIPSEPELEVDVAITGHPYYAPFPPPHYQRGFGTPRAELARGILERGWNLGLWGPRDWLDPERGGDSSFAPYYRGWLDPSQVHRVHRSARVCLATQLVEGRRYDSGRLPWVLGAGGCLAHEHRPGLEEEFGGAVGWFQVGSVGAAMDKVEFLLAHPVVREDMRREGQRVVLGAHTWRHRAARLVELVGAL